MACHVLPTSSSKKYSSAIFCTLNSVPCDENIIFLLMNVYEYTIIKRIYMEISVIRKMYGGKSMWYVYILFDIKLLRISTTMVIINISLGKLWLCTPYGLFSIAHRVYGTPIIFRRSFPVDIRFHVDIIMISISNFTYLILCYLYALIWSYFYQPSLLILFCHFKELNSTVNASPKNQFEIRNINCIIRSLKV